MRGRPRRRPHQRGAGDPSAARAPQHGTDRGRALRRPRRRHDAARAPAHRRRGRRAPRDAPGLGLPGTPLRARDVLRRGARGRGALRRGREDEARGERPVERDPHVRAPLRHRGRGPRPRALRVGRTGSRCGDARRHGAPPRVRRAARARADGRRPRARAPGARRLQPARDPRVPSGRVGLDGVAEGHPGNMRAGLLLLALAVLARVPARAEQGVTDAEILLGGANSFSGPLAFTGEQATRFGVDLYFKAVNDGGGIHGRKVRTVYYDDGYKPQEAVANTRKLLEQDGVFAIIAPQGTPPVVATLEYLEENRVPLLFPFQGSPITRGRKWVFSGMTLYDRQSRMMIDYLVGARKFGKFATLYQDDEYGKSFLTALEKDLGRHGLKLVATESVKRGVTDVSAQMAKLQAARPDVLFLVLTPGPGAQALRERQKIGWSEVVMVSSGPLTDERYLALAGDA